MSTATKLGTTSLLMAILSSSCLISNQVLLGFVALLAGLVAFVLGILAGGQGSRWWLAIPVLIAMYSCMAITLST